MGFVAFDPYTPVLILHFFSQFFAVKLIFITFSSQVNFIYLHVFWFIT